MTHTNQGSHLTDEQKKVLFEKATEAPFTGKYLNNKATGIYTCANCDAELFSSNTKFDSGSGWPSFYDVAKSGKVTLEDDRSFGMWRVAVHCANCGGHLGHVFNADILPSGKYYCINSCSLDFKPALSKTE